MESRPQVFLVKLLLTFATVLGIQSLQITTQNRYLLHKFLGQRIKIHCDIHMTGFLVTNVKVVWSLALHRLSTSGCDPKDPVMTLVELAYVNSQMDADQLYQFVDAPRGWTFHAEGAALNQVGTNAHTAWIGITIESARLEDSGIYRCDALVGELDGSVANVSRSSFTEFRVTSRDHNLPGFTHITRQEALSALDYDSSVILPTENHRRVGQSVNVTCSPSLLRNAPRFPFPVSSAAIIFLPFHQPDSEFRKVASYSAQKGSIKLHPLAPSHWKLGQEKAANESSDVKNSSRLRIVIEIPAVTLEDTGIFLCTVTKATTGNIYQGEAGLKVSRDANLLPGYCDPSGPPNEQDGGKLIDLSPPERKVGFDNSDSADLAPKVDANGYEIPEGFYSDPADVKPIEVYDNTLCYLGIFMIILEIIAICWFGRKHYWHLCCCCCPNYCD